MTQATTLTPEQLIDVDALKAVNAEKLKKAKEYLGDKYRGNAATYDIEAYPHHNEVVPNVEATLRRVRLEQQTA